MTKRPRTEMEPAGDHQRRPTGSANSLPALWTRGTRKDLVLLALNGSAQAGAAAASALLVSRGFDRLVAPLTSGSGTGRLWPIALGFLLVGSFAAWLRVDEAVRSQRLGQGFVHRLRLRMWDHLGSTPWSEVSRRRRSGVLLRFTGDISSIQKWITHGAIGGSVAALVAIGALSALAFLSLRLTAAVLIVLLIGTLWSAAGGARLRRVMYESRRARSSLVDDVEERVEALATVQASGQGRRERKRISRRSDSLRRALLRAARVSGGLRAVGDIGAVVIVVLVLLLGSYEVATGHAGAGVAVAALVVSRFLVGPVRRVARAHQHWQQSQVARAKLTDFLTRPTVLTADRRRRLPDGLGRLVLRDLRIDGVLRKPTSLRVPAGRRVTLVGPNGAGKSTLLRVLGGLEPSGDGRILLDGVDMARCNWAQLRSAIGFVSVDQPLMRGSVRRNLLYRSPEASSAEVERVAKATGLSEVFVSLDERVARGGANLSTGQRQRLLLARALIGSPRLLLLDEPEVHLDESGVEALRRVVENFEGTVVWATHDENTIARADRVWRLGGGRLRIRRLQTANLEDRDIENVEEDETGSSTPDKPPLPPPIDFLQRQQETKETRSASSVSAWRLGGAE